MPEIRPFAGVLYRVPGAPLSTLLAPPYDVISPEQRDALYARDARNIVRVILNREPDGAGYADAGATYRRWLADGTLAADAQEALYVLEQSFAHEGRTLSRYGLLARFRAEDPERGVVLPHEQTRKAAKEDRWRVLQATRANFSPIFLMVRDARRRLLDLMKDSAGAPAALEYTDDAGVGHRLWRVTEASAVARFVEAVGAVKAYIADGHHRYATALRYRDATGPDGAFTLGYFTPVEAEGLVVLPYHRIASAGPSPEEAWHALEGYFRVSVVPGVAEAAHLADTSRAPRAFALAWPSGRALLAESVPEAEGLLAGDPPPSLRALDTYFLHRAVLPRLAIPEEAVLYVHSLAEAAEAVAYGRCRLAVLMRSTPVGQILDVAEARESMPAKSTFFHPKLPSGLVIHPLLA
jgi:uncharacterized protein (DUF1015 family)